MIHRKIDFQTSFGTYYFNKIRRKKIHVRVCIATIRTSKFKLRLSMFSEMKNMTSTIAVFHVIVIQPKSILFDYFWLS